MTPKKNRPNTKEVERIFKVGKVTSSTLFTFRFILVPEKTKKISFIVPKSISKLAVQRNSLRRLGYRVLKNYLDLFPSGVVGVFVFKKYEDGLSTIENEIENIVNKIN